MHGLCLIWHVRGHLCAFCQEIGQEAPRPFIDIERVLKEWVIPGQAGNKRPKRKCDLSSKIKFLVDRLFIPVSTLYLHSSFALKVQVAAQSLF